MFMVRAYRKVIGGRAGTDNPDNLISCKTEARHLRIVIQTFD